MLLTGADAYFDDIWDRECDDAERLLLEKLAVDNQPPDLGIETTRGLLHKEVLEQRDEQIVMSVPLFTRWLREKKFLLKH